MDVTKTIRDISELTPKAQRACRLFLDECEKCGLKVLITETYRSQERQEYLYAQGRTRAGSIVTWTRNSRHTSRRAWDIAKNVKGQEYSDDNFFKACGAIAKKFGIIWGGDWGTPDTPHFEISESWNYIEEAEKMTESERKEFEDLKARVKALEEPEMVYGYIDENMPSWAHEAVRHFADKGILKGNGEHLNLNDTKLWILTILYRIIKGMGWI